MAMNNQKMKLNEQTECGKPKGQGARNKRDGCEIEAIFRGQKSTILYRCRKWLTMPNEAEDACQEVFLRAARAWHSFRADCKVETWLYLITKNVCFNFNRRARRRRYGESLEYNDQLKPAERPEHWNASLNQEEALACNQLLRLIESGLADLSTSCQEIMRLKIHHGLTYDEVGVKLGLPAGTVKSRVFRARHKLREGLLGGY